LSEMNFVLMVVLFSAASFAFMLLDTGMSH